MIFFEEGMNVIAIPWLILASIFLILEMLTGGFYLLALALGFVFGALLDWFNVVWSIQVFVVSFLILIGFFGLKFWRKSHIEPALMEDNLDIGALAVVVLWSHKIGRIRYRGTEWAAISDNPQLWLVNTEVTICRAEGSLFVVESCR
ncbi:MAG: NfeD family protein [Neisseriaceae bacterium]|nr:NfeD family protein [Neisseriaceae bacterium]